MQDLKLVLSKYIVRRKLEGGEFVYVYRPKQQSVSGKKSVLSLLTSDEKTFSKLRDECERMEEDDGHSFEAEILKVIPQLPYETVAQAKEKPTSHDDEGTQAPVAAVPHHEMKRTIQVGHLAKGENKISSDECEAYIRNLHPNVITSRDRKSVKGPRTLWIRVTFQTNEEAAEFLSQEHKVKECVLEITPYRELLHQKNLRMSYMSSLQMVFMKIVFWLEENSKSLENYLIINSDQEGLQSELASSMGVSSVKSLILNSKQKKGFLVEFSDQESAEAFFKIKQEADDLSFTIIKPKEFLDLINNLNTDSILGEDGANPERKIVVLQNMKLDIVRNMFPEAVSVSRLKNAGIPLIIVEFAKEATAKEADSSSEGGNCLIHHYMKTFVNLSQKVLSQRAFQKQGSIDSKCAGVEVESGEDSITLASPQFLEQKKTDCPEKSSKKINKETPQTQAKGKSKGSQTIGAGSVNKLLQERTNAGPSDWDCFVAVGNLKPKNPNMGTPNEMDVCNYFLHNHKNVADVKFLPWTNLAAVVKFNSKEDAERFVGQNYVMFYGSEVSVKNVPGFLKDKSMDQKNQVSRMCLNKNHSSVAAGAGGDGLQYVQLTGIDNETPKLRKLFIENLNLTEKDVGKMFWQNSVAMMVVKLPAAAVSLLVKRWNSMNMELDGVAVTAEVTDSMRGTKRSGEGGKKKNKKRKN